MKIWGQVRPADGPTTVEIQVGSGDEFEAVKSVNVTSSRGYFETTVPYRSRKRWRLKWSNGSDYFSRKAAAR